jgi:hypothetical protein
LVIVVASAAIAVYGWLDTAVSLDHARQQQSGQMSIIEQHLARSS